MTHVIGYICCVCSKRKHAPGYICCRIKLNSFVISLCPITEIIPPPPGLHRLRQKREGQTHHKYQLCCYCWLLNEKYSRSNRENITQCYIMTDRLTKKSRWYLSGAVLNMGPFSEFDEWDCMISFLQARPTKKKGGRGFCVENLDTCIIYVKQYIFW